MLVPQLAHDKGRDQLVLTSWLAMSTWRVVSLPAFDHVQPVAVLRGLNQRQQRRSTAFATVADHSHVGVTFLPISAGSMSTWMTFGLGCKLSRAGR